VVPKQVSKKKDDQTHDYELVLIINPEIMDESLDTTLDKVHQFITGNGGVISNTEQWGKRKLTYPIKRFAEGNYVLTQFKLKPTLSKELEASVQISEEVLRHLLIKLSS
jgi:small subunit ribosomal protein S6